MARFGNIEERHVVRDRIIEDTREGVRMDNRLPLWGGEENVRCHQIRLPLNHLFLRLGNARTVDTQIAFTNTDADFPHPLTGEIIETPDEGIFDVDRQYQQESQNFQAVLLCIEANKPREDGRSLFDTLTQDGWRPREVPIITRDGVLINGNTRVAALEALLEQEAHVPGIERDNPQIDVRVVPNIGAGEADIIALENYLQKPDGVRLNYNWYQDTTVINRRLNGGETIQSVHQDYKDLTRFETVARLEKTLDARTLVDEIFASIGKPSQAILHDPNEHMIYAMQDQMSKDYITSSPEYRSKALAVFAALTQITLESRAVGEMRYHVTRIKEQEHIDRFTTTILDNLEECITPTEIEDEYDGSISRRWELNPDVFEDADDATKDQLAESVDALASDLHMENRAENREAVVLNRLRDAARKIESSMEVYQRFEGNYPRAPELRNRLTEVGRQIRAFLNEVADNG